MSHTKKYKLFNVCAMLGIFFVINTAEANKIGHSKDRDCQEVARLIDFHGQISIKPKTSVIRFAPTSSPINLCEGDSIFTYNGTAKIQTNTFEAILDKQTIVTLKNIESEITSGKIYLDFKTNILRNTTQIKTRLATIGVKGTSFLVTDDGDIISISMVKGEVEISPLTGQIKLYEQIQSEELTKKSLEEEFSGYVKNQEIAYLSRIDEFETWISANEKSFIGYMERISLTKDSEIQIQHQTAIMRRMRDFKEIQRMLDLFH